MATLRTYDRGAWLALNQLAGTLPELFAKERLLGEKWRKRVDSEVSNDDSRLRVPASVLEAAVELDRSRIARIEDKARGTLVGITIAVSVAGAGIGMFGETAILGRDGSLACLAAAVLVVGLSYFLLSGWLALSAYAASPIHTPDIQDRPETQTRSGSEGQPMDDEKWRRTLLDSIDLNRLVATEKMNRFSASITLLRNGLVCIFVFAVLAIAGALGHVHT